MHVDGARVIMAVKNNWLKSEMTSFLYKSSFICDALKSDTCMPRLCSFSLCDTQNNWQLFMSSGFLWLRPSSCSLSSKSYLSALIHSTASYNMPHHTLLLYTHGLCAASDEIWPWSVCCENNTLPLFVFSFSLSLVFL